MYSLQSSSQPSAQSSSLVQDSPGPRRPLTSPRRPRFSAAGSAQDLFSRPIDASSIPIDPGVYDFDAPNATVAGFKSHIRLKPHQVISRQWMRNREDPAKAAFGGILADDMGLGKTIQVLALIVDSIKQKRWTGATLVICPSLDLIHQWEKECDTISAFLEHTRFHRSLKYADPAMFRTCHVVFTTYDTMKSSLKKDNNSLLFCTDWFRIVLDEAHHIRNHNTLTCKAACQLKATFRWCLSGTPLHNSVMDLHALFKFLRIPQFEDLVWFKSHIGKALGIGNESGWSATTPREALLLLQDGIKKITLRRLKDQEINGRKLVDIPPKFINTVVCTLDPEHRDIYNAFSTQAWWAARNVDPTDRPYMIYWALLTRLRQTCNHPSLIFHEDVGTNDNDLRCKICGTLFFQGTEKYCRRCRPLIEQAQSYSLHTPETQTAKVAKTLEILQDALQRGEKTIVYSQWTTMLDVLQPAITAQNIKSVRYDGSMSMGRRRDALNAINSDDFVCVILISLMAGGEGLDLQSCSNVIFIEPWWNPAVEHQAFDRAHRIGQKNPVNVYKLVTEDTVEGHILVLQEQKERLAQQVLNGGATARGTMSADTLKELLRLGSRR